MKRTQFITAAIVAVITFFSLQVFVGHRYPGYRGEGYGRHGYGPHGYYAPENHDHRYDRRNGPMSVPPLPPADTSASHN